MNDIKISNPIVSIYDEYYKDGDSEWRRLGAIGKVDNIVSLCRNLPHHSILEIGAGDGSILKMLSELNFGEKLFALEISSSGVAVIENKRISRLAECKIFDGYHVPYDNNQFDIVILSHVVEHVEHPRRFLYEASRVAKHLFIEVPLEDTIRMPRDFVFGAVGHINFYSPKTIRRFVQSCNLRILSQIVTNPSKGLYTFKNRWKGLIHYYLKQAILKMIPLVATQLFAYHGALVCEKMPDSIKQEFAHL